MSKISLMALLLIVTVTMVRSASLENEKYKVLLEDLAEPSAAAGKKLLWDGVKIVGTYLCSIDAKECEAVKEYLEEADMEEKEIDDQETKDALIIEADKITKNNLKNFMMLDTVRIALIKLICSHEPKQCPFWRFDSIK